MDRLEEIKSKHPITEQFGDDVTWLILEIERLEKKIGKLEAIIKSDRMGQQIYNEWMKCDEKIRQLEALKEEW